MIELSLRKLNQVVSGQLHNFVDDIAVHGVSIDTRTLSAGAAFFAFKGKVVDAETLLEQARAQGASCAVLENYQANSSLPQIVVSNLKQAMGELARYWRRKSKAKIIAITGSNGKTSTKEMLAAILREQGRTVATVGNYNNELGLPLTILSIASNTQYAVVEMGANHFGEIDYMTSIARPNVAIVTNAAAAHLEGFGSIDGVATAKGEIYDGLHTKGIAIINADDAKADFWRSACADRKIISFGMRHFADVFGEFDAQNSSLRIVAKHGSASEAVVVNLQTLGSHNAMNALAATAAARALKIPLKAIAKALETVAPQAGRLQPYVINERLTILDDSYNANPMSVRAGVRAALNYIKSEATLCWLVLGELGELGEHSAAEHGLLGSKLAAVQAGPWQHKLDALYCLGGNTQNTAQCFGDGASFYAQMPELITALQADIAACKQALLIVVKGSRSAKMELVVKALLGAKQC